MTGTRSGRVQRIETRDPISAAARLIAEASEQIAAADGRVRLAIPGGSAAAAAVAAEQLLRERGFEFEKLLLTWVDERCVPPSSPQSNRQAVRLTQAPGFELPLYLEGERPADAVARVEEALATRFEDALDVVLLGMGGDGHVASLFVGHPPPVGRVAYVGDSPKPPAERITLTRKTLSTARHTFLVATGEEKRDALTRLVAQDPRLPATGLPGLVVCTDLELGEEG